MKLMVPVEHKSLSEPVYLSFGRTPYFLLYDTESKKQEFLDNAAASSEGGAGIGAAQLLVDSGAEAIITFRCGENAAKVLSAAKIKIYKAQNGTVQENIDRCLAGGLPFLTEIHPGHHHGGSRS